MKDVFKSKIHGVKAFFQRQQWKEVFIFIFFLLLAAGFWLLQNLQRNYERQIDLPVRYKNVPPGLAVSGKNPETLHLVLKDKGTTLMYYSWKSNFDPVDLPVDELLSRPDSSQMVSRPLLESIISKQLISSTSIVSINPENFYVRYDSLCSAEVPVVANVNVEAKPGFQLSGSIKIEPASVRIYAARSTLDTLKEVKTKPINLENVSKTKEIAAHLQLPANANSEPGTVKLTVPVEEFTEKKMEKQIACNDIPEGYFLRVFPSSVEIICSIPMSRFKDLQESDIGIQMQFEDFERNQTSGKLPVKITEKPLWVAKAVAVPNEVEFIIEQVKHD